MWLIKIPRADASERRPYRPFPYPPIPYLPKLYPPAAILKFPIAKRAG